MKATKIQFLGHQEMQVKAQLKYVNVSPKNCHVKV